MHMRGFGCGVQRLPGFFQRTVKAFFVFNKAVEFYLTNGRQRAVDAVFCAHCRRIHPHINGFFQIPALGRCFKKQIFLHIAVELVLSGKAKIPYFVFLQDAVAIVILPDHADALPDIFLLLGDGIAKKKKLARGHGNVSPLDRAVFREVFFKQFGDLRRIYFRAVVAGRYFRALRKRRKGPDTKQRGCKKTLHAATPPNHTMSI